MASLPPIRALIKPRGGTCPPPAGQSLAAAALDYARRGWSVVPLHAPAISGGCTCGNAKCDRPGAHPAAPAMADPRRVRRYWGRFPFANVGIDLAASGVVAIEAAPGRLAGHPDLPRTIAFTRPCGGLTVIYTRPTGVGLKSGRVASPRGLAVLVRASGFVVMPPSVAPAKAVNRG